MNKPTHTNADKTQIMAYSGAVPPPALLAQFKEVDASFPERIFKMAEEQNAHIIEIENKTLHYNFISKLIGQLLIVFLVIALMGFSAVSFLVFKNNIAGVAGILGTVGTTVITAIKKIQK